MRKVGFIGLFAILGAVSLTLAPISVRAAVSDKVEVASDLSTKNVRKRESRLAGVIADAFRSAESTDIAFVSASSFDEVTIRKGMVAAEDILKALTYHDDSLLVVKLTGEQIRKALEHSLSLYPQPNSALLQVSGITVTFDPSAEKGKRVVSVKVGGSILDPGKKYTVAMPAPLANGGLAYYTCWPKSAIDMDRGPAKSLDDAVTSYLSSHKTIGNSTEEHLVFQK